MKVSKQLSGLATLCLCVGVGMSDAQAQDARVYYKDGTTIETGDFNMKLNLLVQPNFSYTDYDEGARGKLGLDDANDTASFDVRRVRLRIGGDMLQKSFSYLLYTDLRSDGGGSELQDAWLQWNSGKLDSVVQDFHARWGQMNVPFSRQKLNADQGLQMVDRSLVSDEFSLPREMGALFHGSIVEGITYAAGAYNGLEGINQAGRDNKLLYTAAFTASTSGYGARAFEGDLREDTSSCEATGGVAAYYFEGTPADLGDLEQFALNVDLGAKGAGFSGQTEFYYRTQEFDGGDSLDDFGFYVQGGYMVAPAWELALRFGLLEPDADDTETEEYSAVVNYFVHGHSLKIQTGVNFIVDNFGDEEVSDFQFITQLTGFI